MAYGIGRNIALLVKRINEQNFFELEINLSIKYKLLVSITKRINIFEKKTVKNLDSYYNASCRTYTCSLANFSCDLKQTAHSEFIEFVTMIWNPIPFRADVKSLSHLSLVCTK